MPSLPVELLLLVPAFALHGAPAAGAELREEPREAFVRLHAAGDRAGVLELWRAHPAAILTSIDEDLEGSLALHERAPDAPDAAAIAALHARALWGADAASEATGNPIFADYAGAFVGWDAAQKRDFRAGQAAYGRARKALKEGDHAAAARAGRECAELALPLGDWWGFAMGLAAAGDALALQGKHAEAVGPLAQARQVYRALRLEPAEYGAARSLARSLAELQRTPRALACARAAAAQAERLGDPQGLAELLALQARLERAAGDEAAAAATEAELERTRR